MKAKLLQTAYQLFSKFGIKSVSVDDICTKLHMSKKTFYTIFSSKEELVAQMLECERKAKNEKTEELLAAETNIIDIWLQNFNQLNKKSVEKHIALLYDLEKFYPEVWSIHKTKCDKNTFKNTKIMLQKGIEQNLFRADLNIDATAMILSEIVPKSFKKLDKLTMSNSQKISFISDICIRMVCSEKGLEYYQQNFNKNQK